MFVRFFICMSFFAFLFPSCGYRLGHGAFAEKYSTINIPYVEGDKEGKFTAELVRQLSHSGAFEYKENGADLLLKVRILDFHDENVGFQYARDEEGKLVNRIIPSEARIRVLAEVSLEEEATGKVLLGPRKFSSEETFDFDSDMREENLISFSLGQFNTIDAARDLAIRPLGISLAGKIVDYLVSGW